MLSKGAQVGLHWMLWIGCFLNFIPFIWNSQTMSLTPTSKIRLAIFKCHVKLLIFLTLYVTIQLIRFSFKGNFPLVPKLLTALWLLSHFTTMVCIVELNENIQDVMCLGNQMLIYIRFESTKNPERTRFEIILTKTFYLGLFLLLTNPSTHTRTVYQAPCAPPFVSSVVLACHSFGDSVSSLELCPFILFEYYCMSLNLFLGSFHWAVTLLTLSWITRECKKLGNNVVYGFNGRWQYKKFIVKYRKLQLMITSLNESFRMSLIVYSSVPFLIVALLLFGFIRLWRQNSDIMFPLCGFRCAFEASTPLIVAASLSTACHKMVEQWAKASSTIIKLQRGKGIQHLRKLQRSCRRIVCEAGSMYTCDRSIVLSNVDNCIQLTVNLLVSF